MKLEFHNEESPHVSAARSDWPRLSGWGAALLALAAAASSAPLPHEAYVWQRTWSPAVGEALAVAAPRLAGVVVLVAELTPSSVVRVAPDYPALVATGKPVGLALRIGARAPTAEVPALAAQLLAAATSNGLTAAELQLDYDCPESKLESYRELSAAVRRQIAPTPLTITALPSWLNQAAFVRLAAATDGFVLQVHSLDATLTLCDPTAARTAVARASRCGTPFRIALPTYGYGVGVAPDGKLLGVQAEGASPLWPQGTVLREVRADPVALAGLVQEWNAQPPPNLTGFLWYRLPVAADQMNWPWPTLAAIVEGRVPRPELSVAVRQPQPGLVEIELLNAGEADALARTTIRIAWRDAELLACDALAGFAKTGDGADSTVLRFAGNPRLAPAGRRTVGWLRFREAKEVHCEALLE